MIVYIFEHDTLIETKRGEWKRCRCKNVAEQNSSIDNELSTLTLQLASPKMTYLDGTDAGSICYKLAPPPGGWITCLPSLFVFGCWWGCLGS